MKRRTLLTGAVGFSGMTLFGLASHARRIPVNEQELEDMRSNWKDSVPADFEPDLDLSPVELSKQEWKEQLSGEAFDVLRNEGTERAFTSPLNDVKQPGVFLCAGCELPLFTTAMKYDSGTGWPSFFTHIPGHLETKRDFKLIWPRTEYHCIRCGGHQGHVFEDGPPPTGERWCNNGVALKFLARDG